MSLLKMLGLKWVHGKQRRLQADDHAKVDGLAQLLKRTRSAESRGPLRWERLPAVVPQPDLLIDVGAADGTVQLYDAFPTVPIIAIDPMPENCSKLAALTDRYKLVVHQCAVGEARGQRSFYVPVGKYKGSSFFFRTDRLAARPIDQRVVEIHRLDELVNGDGRIGLKLDAEGYEHKILIGSERLIPRVEWVIAEMSMAERFAGDPMFAGVYDILARYGFVFRDIVDLRREKNGALRRIDGLFVKPHVLHSSA